MQIYAYVFLIKCIKMHFLVQKCPYCCLFCQFKHFCICKALGFDRFEISKPSKTKKYHRLARFLHLKGRIGWRIGVIVSFDKWIREKITFHFGLRSIESAHILEFQSRHE